jgi:DNA-binding NarL/FixJ family response regulator
MSTDSATRILLVEDHALFRRGLRRLLTEHGFEVVGEAANGRPVRDWPRSSPRCGLHGPPHAR